MKPPIIGRYWFIFVSSCPVEGVLEIVNFIVSKLHGWCLAHRTVIRECVFYALVFDVEWLDSPSRM